MKRKIGNSWGVGGYTWPLWNGNFEEVDEGSNQKNHPWGEGGMDIFWNHTFVDTQPLHCYNHIVYLAVFLKRLLPNGPSGIQQFFSAENFLQSSYYKTKSATISFSLSLLSFPLLIFLLLLSFSFITVILELLRLKKPAFWRLFTIMTAYFVRLVFKKSVRYSCRSWQIWTHLWCISKVRWYQSTEHIQEKWIANTKRGCHPPFRKRSN